ATYIWTAPSSSAQTYTLSATRGGSTANYGDIAVRFFGSTGAGASNKSQSASGAPSVSLTTQQDNSAIVAIVGDWNAVDGSTRTWRTITGFTPTAGNGQELVYNRTAGDYAVYVAYWPDAGTAGAKTVGLSAPSTLKYNLLAVEVKGAVVFPARTRNVAVTRAA